MNSTFAGAGNILLRVFFFLNKQIFLPMPPVANTRMPTRLATIRVPATVVPPFQRLASTYAISRREVFTVFTLIDGSVER